MATPYPGSLFERLAGAPPSGAGLTREQSMMVSVATHLTKMLSTRAGSVLALPDYGLPDLNDMNKSLHDLVASSRSAIERFIQRYEPRLSEVRVLLEPGHHEALELHFIIEGHLKLDGITRRVRFAAGVGGNGQVSIRSD